MVPRKNGSNGPAFPTTRGTTQRGILSPTLFNVVVDNFTRSWLSMTIEEQRVAHDGLGKTVGQCLGVFYTDDGMVRSRKPDWVQNVINVLVGLFRRYGLVANVVKPCTMTCQPGALRAGISWEALALKCMGLGDSYRVRL